MKTILIVAHTPSPNTKALVQGVLTGVTQQIAETKTTDESGQDNPNINTSDNTNTNTNTNGINGNQQFGVMLKSPLDTCAEDVLNADALILGTTENLAYMAGMTKDFFDRCYYPLLDNKRGMPYAVYIRAGHDGTATKRALQTINNGLRWQMVQEPLILQGEWSDDFIEQVTELGMAMVAGIEMGIF